MTYSLKQEWKKIDHMIIKDREVGYIKIRRYRFQNSMNVKRLHKRNKFTINIYNKPVCIYLIIVIIFMKQNTYESEMKTR